MSTLSEWDLATTKDVVDHLASLMRAATSYGAWSDATSQAAAAVAESLNRGGPPYALQFVAGAVFRDREIVALTPRYAERAHEVAVALGNLQAHELLIERPLDAESAARLGELLAAGHAGPSDKLHSFRIDGLRVRSLAHPEDREGDGWIDAAIFAAQQTHWALARARLVDDSPETPWPWREGRAVVRCLERAVDAEPAVADRVLEFSPGYWSIIRRAVSAATLSIRMLQRLGSSVRSVRAVAHATLAMGLQGYQDRDGAPVQATATLVHRRMLAADAEAVTGIDPHRLRTTSLLHLLADSEAANAVRTPIAGLIHLAYHLERVRCPGHLRLELTRGDLWAYAYANAGKTFDPAWVRMLETTYGPLPIGTMVRTADGAVGPVAGPGVANEPWRPRMFAANKSFVPSSPVTLVGPAER